MKWARKDPNVFPAAWHMALRAGPGELRLLFESPRVSPVRGMQRNWQIFCYSMRQWGGEYAALEARYARRTRVRFNFDTQHWELVLKVSEHITDSLGEGNSLHDSD